jgi:hypothetical protein
MLAQSPVPTTSTCDSGQTSILEMDSVFQSLAPSLQVQFQSAHDEIMSRYNATWYPGIDWIPFNPACGTIYSLGIQADGLTAQMQSAEGQAPIGVSGPASGSQSPFLAGLLGSGNTTVLVIGGLILAYLLLKR